MSLFGRTKYTDEHLDWVFQKEMQARSDDYLSLGESIQDAVGIHISLIDQVHDLARRVKALEDTK